MQEHIQLKIGKWPKMLSDLKHSNQFLKMFSIFTSGISLFALLAIILIGTRPPVVLALDTSGAALRQTIAPKAEDQIKEAINAYVSKRYRWEPNNVKQRLAEASAFISPLSAKAYQSAVAGVARFSTEKLVSQRVYPETIEVDLDKRTAVVTGDRVTAIQGLQAAGKLKLELSFESGPRTVENPWGVYIAKEREE